VINVDFFSVAWDKTGLQLVYKAFINKNFYRREKEMRRVTLRIAAYLLFSAVKKAWKSLFWLPKLNP